MLMGRSNVAMLRAAREVDAIREDRRVADIGRE